MQQDRQITGTLKKVIGFRDVSMEAKKALYDVLTVHMGVIFG